MTPLKNEMGQDCIRIVLQYCDLHTLVTKCLLLNHKTNQEIRINEIQRQWDQIDCNTLIKYKCDYLLSQLLEFDGLPFINKSELYYLCIFYNFHRSGRILLLFFTDSCIPNSKQVVLPDNNDNEEEEDEDSSTESHDSNEQQQQPTINRIKYNNSSDDLIFACGLGHYEMVQVILTHCKNTQKICNGFDALLESCKKGHLKTVELLLDTFGYTALDNNEKCLIIACENRHMEIVQLLLDFDIEKRLDISFESNTLLWHAVQFGWYSIVKILLNNSKMDKSYQETSIVSIASSNGYMDIVQLLLEKFDDDNEKDESVIQKRNRLICTRLNQLIIEYTNTTDENEKLFKISEFQKLLDTKHFDPGMDDNYLITHASKMGCLEMVKLLLETNKVNPNHTHNNSLLIACEYDHVEIVKLLSPFVDPTDKSNRAIRWACYNGNTEMTRFLLENKNVNPCETVALPFFAKESKNLQLFCELEKSRILSPFAPGANAFLCAICNGNPELIKLLLSNERVQICGLNYDALACAVANDNLQLTRLMIKYYKIDPSINENALLRFAIENSSIQIIVYLLKQKKVNPSSGNNFCIQRAVECGRTNVVKLLLSDKRVDPSIKNNMVIREACYNGYTKIVVMLLEHIKVDPSCCNQTCIISACEEGFFDIVEMLLKHEKVDPSCNNNEPLRKAIKNGYIKIANLLMKDSRVKSLTI